MKPEIAMWLQGQLDAIRVLAENVANTVNIHAPKAATEMYEIQFSCNRAINIIKSDTDEEQGKDGDS